MPIYGVIARLVRRGAALLLALLLLGPAGPLTVAGPARAADISDLKQCAEAASNLVEAGSEVAKAAAKVANAVADPTFVACMSAAGAGDVVTIGFMAAVTAFYATGALGDIHNPEDCVAAVKSKVMSKIAETLNDMIEGKGEIGSLIQPIIDALLPDFAIDLIKTIVKDATSDLAKQATEALWDALGVITSKIECGCAAAGTAAMIKDAYDAVAAKMAEFKGNAGACADILKDPIGFIKSIANDPGAALQALGEVVCNGMKDLGIDACGAFVEAGAVLVGLISDVGEAVWDGVQAVGCAVFGWGCDEGPPPPPPTCSTDPNNASMASTSCVCPAGMGLKTMQIKANTCGSDGKKWEDMNYAERLSCTSDTYTIDKKFCAPCDQYSILNAFGTCQTCPAGLLPGPDGKCSKPVVCNTASGQFVGEDGHSCITCPEGSKMGAGGKCNALPANCSAWPWLQAKSGAAPATGVALPGSAPQIMGLNTTGNGSDSWCACPAGLTNTGTSCEKPKAAVPSQPCPYDWQTRDPATGVCKASCAPNQTYDYPATGDVLVKACRTCPDGQVSYQNTCTSACKPDQVRMVQYGAKGQLQAGCMSCPDGTSAGGTANSLGEHTACTNACTPGSAWQTVQITLPATTIGGFSSPGGTSTMSGCFPCAAGSYAKVGKTEIYGASLEAAVCAACPKLKTSEEGATACHDTGSVHVSLPNGATLPPVKRAIIETPVKRRAAPDNDDDDRPKVRRGPPETKRAPPETRRAPPASTPQRIVCGPGKVANKAGTRCLIDLDDEGPQHAGSGSSAPRGRSGGGGTGTGVAGPQIRLAPINRNTHVD